jgi:RNA polymerase sigma factor (sigma-70 family)
MRISNELIERCKGGVNSAQVQLYELCYPRLMPVCKRYVGHPEEAREMLNIGFYRVLKGLKKYTYKGEEVFHHWTRRIIINAIIDEFRKTKRYRATIKTTETGEINGSDALVLSADNTAALEMDAEHIHRMIAELPEMQQQVFNLYVIDDYKHKEIAELFNISAGTSRWYLGEARKALQKKVRAYQRNKIYLRS